MFEGQIPTTHKCFSHPGKHKAMVLVKYGWPLNMIISYVSRRSLRMPSIYLMSRSKPIPCLFSFRMPESSHV